MLFFLTFYSSMDPEKSITGSKKILSNTTVFNIDNNWVSNHHIRMISEGSCDTEDCSNDAENSALHHRNKLYFKVFKAFMLCCGFSVVLWLDSTVLLTCICFFDFRCVVHYWATVIENVTMHESKPEKHEKVLDLGMFLTLCEIQWSILINKCSLLKTCQ